MELIFASNNPGKIKEIQELLPSFSIQSLKDIGWEKEIIEDGNNFVANADIKSKIIYNQFKTNVFADDSGLVVEALNGEPGVDTAHYAGSRDSKKNIEKLLKNLENKTNRKAYFISVISLVWNGEIHHFEGRVYGEILTEIRGEKGFGYDPIFSPLNYDISFAEMPSDEKNKISHRGQAIAKLVEFLKLQL